MTRIPLHPRNPERICWGCDRYCPAEDLACGNGTIRTLHPIELFGDDWDGSAVTFLPLRTLFEQGQMKCCSRPPRVIGPTRFIRSASCDSSVQPRSSSFSR